MEDYESAEDPAPYLPYGLTLKHKHLPEMKAYGRLTTSPCSSRLSATTPRAC